MKRLGTIVLISAVCFSLTFGVIGCAGGPPSPSGEEPSGPEATSTAEVKVLENSISVNGFMYGEIQNTGDTWARATSMTVEFYDSRGYLLEKDELLGRIVDNVPISVLSPGQKSPFKVFPPDEPHSQYTFEIECEPTSPRTNRNKIEILNINRDLEYRHFEVELHNNGDEELCPHLVATYYDSQGRVIDYMTGGGWSAGCCLEPLLPNQVGTYLLGWPYSAFYDSYIQVY